MIPAEGTPLSLQQDATAREKAQIWQAGRDINNVTQPAEAITAPLRPPVARLDREPTVRGRDADLSTLESMIDSPDASGPRVRVLHGLGGSGKTTVALTLARRVLDKGVPAWWISAADQAAVTTGFQALAVELGARSEELRLGSLTEIVWRLLDQRTKPWLLILDNADDLLALAAPGGGPSDGNGWIRPVHRVGLMVITSREGRANAWAGEGRWLQRLRVGRLSSHDGAAVLRELAGPQAGSVEEAETLSHRLGGLPLALRLAGLYLQQTANIPAEFADTATIANFVDYRVALDNGRLDLLADQEDGDDLPDDHLRARNDIRRTWELSLDLLEQRRLPLARPVLRLLAFFAHAPLPFRLILHPATMSSSSLFPGLDGPTLWRTLQGLAGLGLIDIDDVRDDHQDAEPQSLSLHPLVRDTNRDRATGQIDEYLALDVALLYRATGEEAAGKPADPARWRLWQSLEPHVFGMQATAALARKELRPVLLRRIGFAALRVSRSMRARLTVRGLPAEAALQTTVHHLALLLGNDHPDILTIRQARAIVLRARGEYAVAETELRAVLEARRRTMGDNHPETLNTRDQLDRLTQLREGNSPG